MTSRRLVLTAPLFLSGCLLGPNYEKPQTATPPVGEYRETMGFRPAMPRELADKGTWWMIFGDPELDRLAMQVEISNQTLKASEAAYRQAVALIRQAQSGLYPTIGYTGSAQQTSKIGRAHV